MAARELLQEKLTALDREIEAAEDYYRSLELTPRPPGLARLTTEVFIYLERSSVERRIFTLKLNRSTARVCVGARERATLE